MKVKIESCWGGNANYYFRATTPDGSRFIVHVEDGEYWSRSIATRHIGGG